MLREFVYNKMFQTKLKVKQNRDCTHGLIYSVVDQADFVRTDEFFKLSRAGSSPTYSKREYET
jgi:hypothetical protein